ncbi:14 kDa phosphohistidine phosphatase-like isoform X2 [Hyposmocoma kahamanoa]|uniref:14 kDa phosphohistidine phosphatase-like isoform X2 n=1 Tax=Hyposmocoma kahamanoa TaxID=1477025 RepID=UPI000E6D913E|nr:14 kDa phosphohistidine phosphatase-like isoform X2 [Hyposmocoma kahamanoa]
MTDDEEYDRNCVCRDLESITKVNEELQPLCGDEVLGGGIITHDSNSKTINIFGKSDTYGEANHAATARLIREAYPDYKVTFNNK